jgi:hypothetical protein
VSSGKGFVRVFDLSNRDTIGSAQFTCVNYTHGINMFRHPSDTQLVFHIWMQLGAGSSGVCCFATVETAPEDAEKKVQGGFEGAPCVLKIFPHMDYRKRPIDAKALAQEELQNWHNVYHKENWTFCKVHCTNTFTVLVRPYLHVPDKDKQETLLGDAAAAQESAIWHGLERFAKPGWKHDDLHWRHVGILPEEGQERVFLFDLGQVSPLEESDKQEWITSGYKKLYYEWQKQNE